jgi:hypothetical protein
MSNFEDGPTAVNGLVNFLYGKEADTVHGKIARYIQDHVMRRPADGEARWPSFQALRTANIYYGHLTVSEIDAAIAAYRADHGG